MFFFNENHKKLTIHGSVNTSPIEPGNVCGEDVAANNVIHSLPLAGTAQAHWAW